MPNPYGQPISLEQAKKVAAPAIAVVDTSGNHLTVSPSESVGQIS
jgi:hypothetical protein